MVEEKKVTKAINVRMEEDFHRQFKVYVTNKGTTMQDFILELIKEKLQNDNKG